MKRNLLIALTFLGGMLNLAPASAVIDLPAPSCGIGAGDNCLVFNDATVYSLALLDFLDPNSPTFEDASKIGQQSPWYIKSNTGAQGLENKITIMSSPPEENNPKNSNQTDVCTGECDNAYAAPNDAQGGNDPAFFAMIGPDPDPTGGWDNLLEGTNGTLQGVGLLPNPNSIDINGIKDTGENYTGQMPLWDISKEDLLAYVDAEGGTNDVVIGFALNETNPDCSTNTGGILEGCQDMIAWATIYLTDELGNVLHEYILNGENTTLPIPAGVPGSQKYAQDATNNILPDSVLDGGDQDWAFVHGQICVASDGSVAGLGACDSSSPAGSKTVNQNLGGDNAAFLVYNEDLNDQLRNDSLVANMTVDFRMGYVDNGPEALFILPARVGYQVPEPAVMLLIGAGFIGFGITRHAGDG